jgi:hypothetical protein
MLTQPSEGNYHIEDLTCQVPLDLSNAQCTAGLFTENCIIVTEGEMVDGKFRVNMVCAFKLMTDITQYNVQQRHDKLSVNLCLTANIDQHQYAPATLCIQLLYTVLP